MLVALLQTVGDAAIAHTLACASMQKKASQDSLFAALGVAPAKSPTESGATLFTSDKERADDPHFGGDILARAPSKASQPMPASPFKPPQAFKPPPPVVAAPDPLVQASVVDDDPLSMMSAATETAAAAAAAAAKAAAAARKAEELFKSEAVDSVRPIENPLSMPPRGSSSESLSSSAGRPTGLAIATGAAARGRDAARPAGCRAVRSRGAARKQRGHALLDEPAHDLGAAAGS